MRSIHLLGIPRIAFICGCGHSGTTLMATMLSVHPELYVPLNESDAFLSTRWRRIRELNRLRWATLTAGKWYLVEKTPRHIRHISEIRRAAPDAKFIIMVRDGRDVAASIGNRENGNFDAGIERWELDAGLSLKERGRPGVFLLRYEDLIADPPGQMRLICAFLGVPYTDDVLNYHAKPHLWFGKHKVKRTSGVGKEHADLRNWQVNQPIFDGRGRWKKDLPAEVVAKFAQGRPRELMEAFGYAVE